MTSLNVSLPRAMKEYIEAEVEKGGYSTPSEYVRELVRGDQRRRAAGELPSVIAEHVKELVCAAIAAREPEAQRPVKLRRTARLAAAGGRQG